MEWSFPGIIMADVGRSLEVTTEIFVVVLVSTRTRESPGFEGSMSFREELS
jgi:hypothetical protein